MKDKEQKRVSIHLEESYKCPQKDVKRRKHVSLSIARVSGGFHPPSPVNCLVISVRHYEGTMVQT